MTPKQREIIETGHNRGELPRNFWRRLEAVEVMLRRLRADFNAMVAARVR